jgi:hypothetical protein
MSIMAPARMGRRGSFSVFFSGCMQVVVIYLLIIKPLTTKKFAVICCRIEIRAIYGIPVAMQFTRLL